MMTWKDWLQVAAVTTLAAAVSTELWSMALTLLLTVLFVGAGSLQPRVAPGHN